MRSQHTRIYASFHSDNPNNYDSHRGLDRDLRFDFIGLTTDKGFGEASGTWTLTLKPRRQEIDDLLDLFDDPEGVWVRLAAFINGETFDLMIGNVDSLQSSVTRGGKGERLETITVTGRDHGKVFETTMMHINPFERGGVIAAVPAYDIMHRSLQGKPHDFISTLVREWIGNNEITDSQWRLPSSLFGGRKFYDVLNTTTISRRTRGDCQDPNVFQPDQMSRALWDAMTELSNGLLNEMWTDLAPNPGAEAGTLPVDPVTGATLPVPDVNRMLPAIYLRERPFPAKIPGVHRSRWDRLPTFDIYPDDVAKTSFSKGGGANKHNFWMLEGQGLQSRPMGQWALIQGRTGNTQGKPGGFPIYDIESIRRFGLRRFSQSTKFLPLIDTDVGEIAYTVSALWLQLVHDWYVVAPMEISGELTTSRMMPWIRVGTRIRLHTRTGRKIIFYVEHVNQSYSYPGAGATSLTLTRGEPEDRDYLDEVYERVYHLAEGHTLNDLHEDHPEIGPEPLSPEEETSIREAEDPGAAVDGLVIGDVELTLTGGDVVLADEIVVSSSQDADPAMNHDNMMLPTEDEFQSQPPAIPDLGRVDSVPIDTSGESTEAIINRLVESGEMTPEEATLILDPTEEP